MKKYLYLIGTSGAIFDTSCGSCKNGNEGSKSKSEKKPDPLKGDKDELMAIFKFKNDNIEDGESITITKKQITEAKSAEEIENLKQELKKIKTKPVGPTENVVINPNNIDLSQPYIIKFTDFTNREEKLINFTIFVSNGEIPAKKENEDGDDYTARVFNNTYALLKIPEKKEDVESSLNDERNIYFLYVNPNSLTITGYDNMGNVQVSKQDDLNNCLDSYILLSFNDLPAIVDAEGKEELNPPIDIIVFKKPSA